MCFTKYKALEDVNIFVYLRKLTSSMYITVYYVSFRILCKCHSILQLYRSLFSVIVNISKAMLPDDAYFLEIYNFLPENFSFRLTSSFAALQLRM